MKYDAIITFRSAEEVWTVRGVSACYATIEGRGDNQDSSRLFRLKFDQEGYDTLKAFLEIRDSDNPHVIQAAPARPMPIMAWGEGTVAVDFPDDYCNPENRTFDACFYPKDVKPRNQIKQALWDIVRAAG